MFFSYNIVSGRVSSLKSNAGIAWNFWKKPSEVACICSIDAKLYMLARAIFVISRSLSPFIPCSAQGASPGLSCYSLFSSRSHPSFLWGCPRAFGLLEHIQSIVQGVGSIAESFLLDLLIDPADKLIIHPQANPGFSLAHKRTPRMTLCFKVIYKHTSGLFMS